MVLFRTILESKEFIKKLRSIVQKFRQDKGFMTYASSGVCGKTSKEQRMRDGPRIPQNSKAFARKNGQKSPKQDLKDSCFKKCLQAVILAKWSDILY